MGIVVGSVVAVIVLLGVIGAIAGKNNNSTSHDSSAGSAVPVTNSPGTPAGFTAFHSSADQYTIDIPETWKSVDPASPGAQAAMNEIEQSNPDLRSVMKTSAAQLAVQGITLLAINPVSGPDGFASNVNVTARPDLTFSGSDLQQIAASLPGEYAKLGATFTGSSDVTLNGREALRATDTLPLNTPLGARVDVPQTQYYEGANGFVYVVTLSGNDSNLAAIASTFSPT